MGLLMEKHETVLRNMAYVHPISGRMKLKEAENPHAHTRARQTSQLFSQRMVIIYITGNNLQFPSVKMCVADTHICA